MCHKIRHALTESSTDFLLDDYVEVGEAFYGGRKQKGNRGQAQTSNKALIVCAVEKISTVRTKNKGINKQGFIVRRGSTTSSRQPDWQNQNATLLSRSLLVPTLGQLFAGCRRQEEIIQPQMHADRHEPGMPVRRATRFTRHREPRQSAAQVYHLRASAA